MSELQNDYRLCDLATTPYTSPVFINRHKMEIWVWPTAILCLYGFFKEIRPSEPFLTEYLMGPWKNLTHSEVSSEIYPVWTYSSLPVIIVVFIVTDFLRYKPVIVIQGIAYVITWVLLLWAPGVFAMQVMQFVYAIVTAADVAYFTYIYAKVDSEHFRKVTGFTRAARLFGRFLSGVLSQALVSADVLDYRQLNYISLTCVTVALIIACLLPSVKSSVYFHPRDIPPADDAVHGADNGIEMTPKGRADFGEVWKRIRGDFLGTYSSAHQLKWCIWWAMSMFIYDMVGNYVQTLWEVIYPSEPDSDIYNGAVTAVNTFLGAVVSAGTSVLAINWASYGDLTLTLVSFVEGASLLISALTMNIWVAYVCYAIFNCSYDIMIAVVSYQVADKLKRQSDSFGLIFGTNQFVSLFFGTITTMAIVSKFGLHFSTRHQFVVYSGLTFCTAALFLFLTIRRCFGR